MVVARCRPVATHARSAPSPRPLCFFVCSESDGGSAAEVSDLSEMMVAMPPRPKASVTYAFLICIFSYCRNLDRVRISGYLPV
jgi:hypothetical protein